VPATVRHVFTHFELELVVYRAVVSNDSELTFWADSPRCRWVPRRDLDAQALPSVMRKVIAHGLRECERRRRPVLRPGGRTVALIDLTTHAHGRRDPRLMFEFLRFSERTWRLMTSNRSIYVNRLRRSQWRDAYERAGFDIVGEEADAWTDRLDEFRQVPWLDDLSDEDATTRHLWLAGEVTVEVAGG
jgi:hypothetical protein